MQLQSKKILLSTALVIVSTLVLSACLPTKNGSNDQNNSDSIQSAEESNSNSFTGSLKDLVGFGKAQKCTWETKEGMSGVVYTDGNRSYSEMNNFPIPDFNGNGDETQKGSMYAIADNEYLYTWSSVSKEGTKIKNEPIDEDNQEDIADYENNDYEDADINIENRNAEENYDYQCSSWKIDSSKFELPTDIVFKDLSEMMNNQMNDAMNNTINTDVKNTTNDLENMNKICDMLDGTEKQDCLRDFAKINN